MSGLLEHVNVSPFEWRWIKRHPARWLRLVWFHFTVAAGLAAMAWLVGEPVFDLTTVSRAWPILLGVAAGVAALSALAPLDRRLQAGAAAVLFSIFTLRAATFVHTYVVGSAAGVLSPDALAVSASYALHWVVLALVAVWWPTISERAGRALAVEVGADERGAT